MRKLALCILCIFLLAVTVTARAQMKFEETTVDFGEIDSGQEKTVFFKFVNAGDEQLLIKNISSSCGCTVAKLEKSQYAPGEAGKIPVKFKSQGYSGKISKSITISTNDNEEPYSRLKITGKINLKDFATIEVVPDQIDFKDVKMGKEYTKKIAIKNTGTIDLKIIEIAHSPELVPRFKDKVIKPGESVNLELTFTPMQKNRFASFIKLRTNAYRKRMSIIRLNANVE